MRSSYLSVTLLIILTVSFFSCSNDTLKPPDGDYPDEIASILVQKCANTGCHDSRNKDNAGGLDLSTWGHLFEGSRNGSSIIPFRPDVSYLTYFINTYPDLGITLQPAMPYDRPSLSRDEVATINDWINAGAPDRFGHIKFSDDPERSKFYVCNQGCDNVTVFDLQTRLPMRIIDVGTYPQVESPHDIKVSGDGKYWYVIFAAGEVIQKFRASDDRLENQCAIGYGQWTSMTITQDGRYAFIVDYGGGRVTVVDLETMTKVTEYNGFRNPHGSEITHDGRTLYITAQTGNYIYKIDVTNILAPDINELILDPGKAKVLTNDLNPHQIEIAPDGSSYYVSCMFSGEVRVFDINNDSLLAIIPAGADAQEMEFSESLPYLLVTCVNDSVTFPGKIGSIAIINYQTNTKVTSIFSGYQPHGCSVDDRGALVYVANRNVSSQGPAPHHTNNCGGRNGYVTIIDLHTLQLMPDFKIEVQKDPYEVAVRN